MAQTYNQYRLEKLFCRALQRAFSCRVLEVTNPGLFDEFPSINGEEHPIDFGIAVVGLLLHLLDKLLEGL